jgi:hypothetical protein
MRIVLDTNILARANPHSKGVARVLLLTILESPGHVLVTSPFLLRETERVLNYLGCKPSGRSHHSKSSNTRRLSRISRSWLIRKLARGLFPTTKKMIRYCRRRCLDERMSYARWTGTSITDPSSRVERTRFPNPNEC